MALRQLVAALGSRALQCEGRKLVHHGCQLRGFALEQQRTVVSVDVVNNQVDRALKTLKRKLVEDGLPKQWKAHEVRGQAGPLQGGVGAGQGRGRGGTGAAQGRRRGRLRRLCSRLTDMP
jgi:hypothetical protein